MLDRFGRKVDYLRFSITDRCDLRCKYCMPLKTDFYKKSDLLSLEQLKSITLLLNKIGINKIRITGGEPFVRKDFLDYLKFLFKQKQCEKISEIFITTNGTQLYRYAEYLSLYGVNRINVSLDSLIKEKYFFITNGGNLDNVLKGILKAKKLGLNIKINTVLLKNFNDDEIEKIVLWCSKNEFSLSFIEVMPVGELHSSRKTQFIPVNIAKDIIKKKYGLTPINFKTNGPSKYFKTNLLNSKIGFISPISQNFCKSCNRIRITSSGIFYGCLGHDSSFDIKPYLNNNRIEELENMLKKRIYEKPEKHFFKIDGYSAVNRFMNTTGG